MNREAFQIYGLKKTGIFQSTWDTTKVSALGVELAGVAASGSGWSSTTNLNTIGSTHTSGLTSNLVTSRTATAMQTYQIVCTITGTTGTIQVQFGNNTSAAISPGTTTITLMALNTNALTIIPSSSFDGNVRLSVKDSSSATNQIKLPLPNSGTYNIWVDWGDGTYDNITSYNSIKTLHTYPAPGEYTVKITGDRFSFGFGILSNINDRLKIKSISSWGKLRIVLESFNGCSNVTMSGITDILNLTGATTFQYLFGGCISITSIGRINEWNTSSVTSMNYTFNGCGNFNSNISNWDVSNVVNITSMFNGAAVFNQNISSWNVSKVTNFGSMFSGAAAFNNGSASGIANQLPWTINTTSTSVLMSNMFYYATAFNSNLGTGTTPWNVSKVTTFAGMFQGAFNFKNGDDTALINNWNIGESVTGTITLESMFESASTFNRDISGWDVSKVTTFASMFSRATAFNNGLNTNTNSVTGLQGINGWNINTTAASVLMNSMFYSASTFNRDISGWDVSKVTTFASMFSGATAFNNGLNTNTNSVTGLQGINGWNINTTAASVLMNSMFYSASAFNREVGSWNVSKVTLMNNMFNVATAFNNGLAVGLPGTLAWNTIGVTTMRQMFDSATAFNCNVGGFNVSSCIDFGYMFRGASSGSIISRFNNGGSASIADWTLKTTGGIAMDAMFNNAIVFNQPIGSWNVSRVYTMFRMFGNSRFNQPIENWDVSNVNDMASMFEGDILFNQDLSKWNVGKVTTFASMFNNAAAFNNGLNTNTNLVTGLIGINGWNINTTAASVDMSYMFRSASAFNREVSSWNVSKVTSASNMFFSAIAFNQPLANWERVGSTVGNMTNMSAMFQNASAFNQNIGNWNVSKVTTFVQMFQGSGFNNGGSPDINNWAINTTLGTNVNMSSMFSTTGSFNQPIGSWNVSNVTNFSNFMLGKTNLNFSATNLDAIYNGWIVNGVKPNLTNVNFGSANYTSAGATGRAILTNPVGYNWTIIDGGQI